MTGEFAKDMASLGGIFAFLSEFAKGSGLGEQVELTLDLVAEELFTNAVKYGAGGDGKVRLTVEKTGGALWLELVDFNAKPFDPESVEPPPLGPLIGERRAGGLGLRLVRSLMDEVVYEYRDGELMIRGTKHLEN
jgi:anti-sigma regulatory factor (Ser/Thr protein kinase)